MRIFQYISILFGIGMIGMVIYQNSPHYQIIKGEIFGTYYNIKINTDSKNNELKNKIESRLQQINSQMSVFDTNSEISRFNSAPHNTYTTMSSDLSKVLSASKKVWEETNGWFDPSIGKLIDIWGFGSKQISEPSSKEIAAAIKASGFDKLHFSKDFTKVKKTKQNLSINLSAIAKGYAVDEIAAILDSEGYTDYVVEIGGEIKTKGYKNSDKEYWRIGINKPISGVSENILIIPLSNISVATSGNYRNFYSKKGKIYVHTISPKTGLSEASDVLSVSVFHQSCMFADAYATAISAMGLKQGLIFSNKYNLSTIIFDNEMKAHFSDTAKIAYGD